MGVSGSGKSTVGIALARALGVSFVDGDDLHPAANKTKMAAGQPLKDDDRWPWLDSVGEVLASSAPGIVACSALRRAYRDRIRHHVPTAFFVHLSGSSELIADRLAGREHEYMPATLLGSQLDILEPLDTDESGLVVPINLRPDQVVDLIVGALQH